MDSEAHAARAVCKLSSDGKALECSGPWNISGIIGLQRQVKSLLKKSAIIQQIRGQNISNLDSAGAMMLLKIVKNLKHKAEISGLTAQQDALLKFIMKKSERLNLPDMEIKGVNLLYYVGVWAVDKYIQFLQFLEFTGQLSFDIYETILNPKRLKIHSIIAAIETTGFYATPIVALMLFLIGVVLAYQLAAQLQVYGADIYIVDVTGIGILREFAPLITAIIVAGRTSTSFAALIGTMKVNQEIDALQTMGFSPNEWLVLPRMIGLVIALPLLTVLADIFGVLGSMIMTKHMVSIGYGAFLARFHEAVELKQYILGLVKAPIFAIIIAGVGCFQGFQVSMTAESVGHKTTKAAVQAIFLIIIADAMFSVVFQKMGY